MSFKVLFNDVEEFLKELELIERDAIVRVTSERRNSPSFPGSLFQFAAVAGLINGVGQLVELRVYCGDAMLSGNAEQQPAVRHVNEIVESLSRRLAAMGFEVRAGIYAPAG